MRNAVRFALAALVAASVCSCSPRTGDLAAEGTGDVREPLALRKAPSRPYEGTCADGALNEAGGERVTRRPYVQQVTEHGAVVAFGVRRPEPIDVVVTTPDGALVTSARAEIEERESAGGALLAARIEGLEPATLYCYALRGLSARAAFVTAERAGEMAAVRFVAFGDSGTGGRDQRAVFRQMQTVDFDLVLHLGDLAYERGTPSEIERKFFAVYEPLLRSVPVYVAAGNHDYSTDRGAPLRRAFLLPENGGPAGLERWYSFDRGDVHFVALDSEDLVEEQVRWLERDLAANERPWTIVFSHRPPFSSGEHGGDPELRRRIVPLLERWGVDLVLSGHEHDYERFEFGSGPVYVVSGGGGRDTREVGTSPHTAFSEAVLHFVYVEVRGPTLTLHAIDGVGREFDQLRLHQGEP